MAPFSFALTLDEKKVFGDLVQAAASLERRPVVQPPALKGAEELPDAVDDMPALVWVPLPPPITTSAASSSKAKPKGKWEVTSAVLRGARGIGYGILW